MPDQCKLLINELLCFVQCKSVILDEQSLLQICESAFTDKDVEIARKVLADLSLLRTSRQGEGKKKRSLQDIINVVKEQASNQQLPVFVAKDLHRLPPVTFDYIDVSTLLREITCLKQDVHNIQCDYIRGRDIADIRDQVQNLQAKTKEFDDSKAGKKTLKHKNEEHKKNKSTYSADTEKKVDVETDTARGASERPSTANDVSRAARAPRAPRAAGAPRAPPPPPRHSRPHPPVAPENTPENIPLRATISPAHKSRLTFDDTIIDHNIIDTDDSFTTVVNKKTRYRSIKKTNNKVGKAQLTASTKTLVAPRLTYIYASRFLPDTSVDDISTFLQESGKSVVKIEKLTQYKSTDFSSFKLTIYQAQEDSFLSEELWPSGIVYRRFKLKRNLQTPVGTENSRKAADVKTG
ncbi:hypothetical protein NE865_11617 [Phthorimaea operculella]|nr:hypothetical protein NE865_11617 [Phthorimaea operculella]